MTATLLMIVPAPVVRLPGGRLRLDAKFLEGARLHAQHWDGPLRFLMWESDTIPFWQEVDEADLGFDLTILPRGTEVAPVHLAGAALIAASADMHQTLGLPAMARDVGAKLVYTVEYTLGIRLKILRLERHLSLPRKARSALWLLQQERRCRAALRAADGVQFNGWPALEAYGGLNPAHLFYLDGRMKREMMGQPADLAPRLQRLASGAPLRIAHFGRLEPLKGAQDLIPVAQALRARGVDFTLDIWGTGSLAAEVQAGITSLGLAEQVRLHEPLPFETRLIPVLQAGADLFLSCHRQSDPSCSYLEAMGCGLPVAGYDNAMLRRMAETSGAARVVRMGNVQALAGVIADWSADRPALTGAAEKALGFALGHDFETEFTRRMAHFASFV